MGTGRYLNHGFWDRRVVVTGVFSERTFHLADIGQCDSFNDDLRARRNFQVTSLSLNKLHGSTAQSTGHVELIDAVRRFITRCNQQRRIYSKRDGDWNPLSFALCFGKMDPNRLCRNAHTVLAFQFVSIKPHVPDSGFWVFADGDTHRYIWGAVLL